MSWSVAAIGKKNAVEASVAKQFANGTCKEPEQSLKVQAAALVAAVIAASPDTAVLKVTASGCANSVAVYEEGSTTKVIDWKQTEQTLSIAIENVWGFVE
jgi:hypothetical protein